MKEEIEEKDELLKDSQETCQTLEKCVSEKESEISKLSDKINDLEISISEKTQEYEELEAKYTENSGEIETLRSEIENIFFENKKSKEELIEKLKLKEEENNALQSEIQHLQDEINDTEIEKHLQVLAFLK